MSNMSYKASAEENILNPECSKLVFSFIFNPEYSKINSFTEKTQE